MQWQRQVDIGCRQHSVLLTKGQVTKNKQPETSISK